MATEKQLQFYKLLFDEESARGSKLRDQAKTYLSLATLYSAFVIYLSDKGMVQINAILGLGACCG